MAQRYLQPQSGPLQVNRGNPLTKRLKFLALPGALGGSTPYGVFPTGVLGRKVTPQGIAATFSLSSAFNIGRVVSNARQTVLFGFIAPASYSNYEYLFGVLSPNYNEVTTISTTPSAQLTISMYSDGPGGTNVSTTAPPVGSYSTVFARLGDVGTGGDADTYTVGHIATSGTLTSAASTLGGRGKRSDYDHLIGVGIVQGTSPWRNTTGAIVWTGVWDGWLSDEEVARIAANPWQLSAPAQRTSFRPAAGGTPATVNPTGVSATGSVGTPTTTGAAVATPLGLLATTSVGTPVASGTTSIAATALPTGLSAVTSTGQPTAIGHANATPLGIAAVSAVGLPITKGGAVATPMGVSAVTVVGTPTAITVTSIPATVQPIGLLAVASVGTPVSFGAATATPNGVGSTALVGSAVVVGAATALPAGVGAITYWGIPIGKGGAVATPVGVQAATSVGTPTITVGVPGSAFAYPTGIQATSSVGNITVVGAAKCYPLGLFTVSSVGTPLAYGPATESIYRMFVPLGVNRAYVPIALRTTRVPI